MWPALICIRYLFTFYLNCNHILQPSNTEEDNGMLFSRLSSLLSVILWILIKRFLLNWLFQCVKLKLIFSSGCHKKAKRYFLIVALLLIKMNVVEDSKVYGTFIAFASTWMWNIWKLIQIQNEFKLSILKFSSRIHSNSNW